MKYLQCFAVVSVLVAGATLGHGQVTDSNPAHVPDANIENHRPLIQKKQKAPTSRTLKGTVVDDSGAPLEGALVTLTNEKTNEKTNFFTKKDGRFLFEDLSFTIDYEVQAKFKDQISEVRKLSQYDHTPNIVRILAIGNPPGLTQPAGETAKKDTPSQKQ